MINLKINKLFILLYIIIHVLLSKIDIALNTINYGSITFISLRLLNLILHYFSYIYIVLFIVLYIAIIISKYCNIVY